MARYDSGTLAKYRSTGPVGSLVDMVQWSPMAQVPPSTDATKVQSGKEQASTRRRCGSTPSAFSPLAALRVAMVSSKDKAIPMPEGRIAQRSEIWNASAPDRSPHSPGSGRRLQVRRRSMEEDHSIANLKATDEGAKSTLKDEADAEQKKAKAFHSPPQSSTVKAAAVAPAKIPSSMQFLMRAMGTEDTKMSSSECPHVSDSEHTPLEGLRGALPPLPTQISVTRTCATPTKQRRISLAGPYAPGPFKPQPLSDYQSEELANILNALGVKGARMTANHSSPKGLSYSSSAPLLLQSGTTA